MKNREYYERESSIEKVIERGWRFLENENQNGFFPSYISTNRDQASTQQSPREIFTSIMIADTLMKYRSDSELTKSILQYIERQSRQGLLTFFEDRDLLPPDTDTNSLGYSILFENRSVSSEVANKMFDKILAHVDDNGIIQVWLSKDRSNHLDHVVAINAVYFAYLLDRGEEVKRTEDWLFTILDSAQYLKGSRYYHSPDAFLYFFGRLIRFPQLKEKLRVQLAQHLQKRIGKTEYPLDLAMRIILSNSLGIRNELEKQKLMRLQRQDGSWPTDALYREGKKPVFYGNKSVPTAFAIKALSF